MILMIIIKGGVQLYCYWMSDIGWLDNLQGEGRSQGGIDGGQYIQLGVLIWDWFSTSGWMVLSWYWKIRYQTLDIGWLDDWRIKDFHKERIVGGCRRLELVFSFGQDGVSLRKLQLNLTLINNEISTFWQWGPIYHAKMLSCAWRSLILRLNRSLWIKTLWGCLEIFCVCPP